MDRDSAPSPQQQQQQSALGLVACRKAVYLQHRSSSAPSSSSSTAQLHQQQQLLLLSRKASMAVGSGRRQNVRIVRKSFDENATHRQESSGGLVLQHLPHQRRESFIYRSDSDFDVSPRNSRHSSITGEIHSDEVIVTPFAQVLHTLRSVYEGVKTLTGADNLGGANHREAAPLTATGASKVAASAAAGASNDDEDFNQIANKTLKDLEWCLDQLETIQTHRSVADMASSKFKRLLNMELERMSGSRSQSHQIESYIKSTFLDVDENATATPAPTAAVAAIANCAQLTMTQVQVSAADASAAAEPLSLDDAKRWPLPPNFGVETPRLDELSELFETGLDEWGVDIFLVDELACQKPLTAVVYAVFEKRDFFSKFRIHPAVLVKYFSQVEQHYKKENPYHNAIHAADVTQSTHVLLNAPSIANVFSELEILASIFACAIHDVNHPGVTNQFLINTESELAIMYNDMSVLENHHCAVAFKLLQEPASNIFAGLEDFQRRQLRKMVIDMVLATDMSKHMSLLADLKTMVETKKVAGGCLLKLENYSEKMQIMQNMVHCADLSNPAKPLPLSTQWVTRVMEEFFNQGDREKALGLPVSPMCCRETANVEKSQMSFIDFIVHPLWEAWTELVHPDAEHILNTLEQNRDHYCELSAAKEAEAVREVDEENLEEAESQRSGHLGRTTA